MDDRNNRWEGRGWKRTQRQLGVIALIMLFIFEFGLDKDVPIFLYTTVWGLLGFDYLVEAMSGLRK